MKSWLLLLALLIASSSTPAELFKCTVNGKSAYQDKPCQDQQTQRIIPSAPPVATSRSPKEAPPNQTGLSVSRDQHGRIQRSEKAKNDFKATHPCPGNGKRSGACPGYVIDHINPLACGGADRPENMQWQTVEEGKAKDRWERTNCKAVAVNSQPGDLEANERKEAGHQTHKNREVYTGRRGGRYVMTEQGKKRYLKRKINN